jgi:hypothetical protein
MYFDIIIRWTAGKAEPLHDAYLDARIKGIGS